MPEVNYTIIMSFLIIIALAMVAPILYDMHLAYGRNRKRVAIRNLDKSDDDSNGQSQVHGMPGLYRTIMTSGIILILGSVIFYLLTALNANIVTIGSYVTNSSITTTANVTASLTQINHELTQQLTTITTILGGAVASIIGFYFGNRAAESSTKAAGDLAEASEERGKAESLLNVTSAGAAMSSLKVIGTYPAKNQQNVKRSTNIIVTFNEALDPSTLDDTTFDVRKEGSNTTVPGTLKVLPEDDKMIMFDPASDLEPNSTYIVTILKKLRSMKQNELGRDETWSFKTGP